MTERIIEVTVSPTGKAQVETKGFAGRDCLKASAFLEVALGQRQSDRVTSEYYEVSNPEEVRQQN